MEFKIHEGMRVLYKHNNQWEVGVLIEANNTKLTEKGLFLSVIPKEFIDTNDIPFLHDAEINDIYFDATPLEDWVKQYPQYFMTKEDYIKLTQEEDFDRQRENAYVSDGEYMYYPVSKYSKSWIEKQPFEYIVRSNI